MATVTSAKHSVEIATGRPTVLVGERINPTGRQRLADALAQGDLDLLLAEATRQVEAGAHVLDVNVAYPGCDEPALLREAVSRLSETVEVPLCVDSANPLALEAALAVYPGRALVNSVTCEPRSLEAVLPLVKRYHAMVVGMPMNDEGIPDDPGQRLHIAAGIVEAAARQGIPAESIVIDCLATAAAAHPQAALAALGTIRLVSRKLGVNTLLGLSNISFGLPGRGTLNACFLSQAIAAGVTCVIADPTAPGLVQAMLAADFLAGRDSYARRYIGHHRRTHPR